MNNPEQTELDRALTKLRLLPDFQLVIEHVKQERETYIKGQYEATTGEMAIKASGSIVALDFLYGTLKGVEAI